MSGEKSSDAGDKPSVHSDMAESVQNKSLLEQAKTYAFDYIDEKDSRTPFPASQDLENLTIFDERIPECSQNGAEILEQLHTFGAPATCASTGGRYFGFVNGNTVPTALAARWMADVWDQNAALYVMSPIASKLEHVVEGWCVDLLGLPDGTAVGLVGGTSVANICALAAARNQILKRQGWDVYVQGLFGAPPIKVVVSEQAHGCVGKALALLGLGSERVIKIPADDQGRICVEKLPALDDSTIIVLQAGHVSTGAFDDFNAVCDLANGAWVHIDGAFGLWAAASQNLKHLTNGIERADSWSVDGHKTLNTPYDCGICLVKDRTALRQAMAATGSYLQQSDNRDGMFYTPAHGEYGDPSAAIWGAIG
jgi:glutamate/tyrosine decarboxylase-like PLP-dependent enzyme